MNGMATRLGQLGLNGPWPRSDKIRLVTRIDNGFSFPRISPSSHNKLASPQRRLKPRTPLHRAPQYRLEPQRLLAFQHGLELRNTIRSTPPQANPPTAYRAPRRWQQRQHNTDPSNNFSVRARRLHCGRRKKLHEPPFLNLTSSKPTSTSTSAMPIMARVISAVIAPLARSRETLMDDAVGGYRGRRACEARINTAMGWFSCYSE